MSFIGRRKTLGIALENVYGVAEVPSVYIPFLSCDLQERHTPIADSSAKGVRDLEGSNSIEGKKWGEGNISVILDPETAPYWLALALGSITSEASGDDYKHTIARAEDQALSATIWTGRVVDEIDFNGAVVDSLELNFADDVAKITAKVLSKYPTTQDRTPSVEKDLFYYTFKDVVVDFGEVSDIKVRELTLNIENNAEMLYALGDNNVDEIIWKGFRVSGSFTLKFEDTVQKTAFDNLSKQDMTLTFSGPTSEKITITIPRVRIDEWKLDGSNDDLVQENISFVAEYDDDTSETISIEVINSTEEYLIES